jgi:hypothetical protein
MHCPWKDPAELNRATLLAKGRVQREGPTATPTRGRKGGVAAVHGSLDLDGVSKLYIGYLVYKFQVKDKGWDAFPHVTPRAL